jgi:hypothetical protein
MDELMDLIATNESPSQVSDKIKDLLFAKSAERLDSMRTAVASQLFGSEEEGEEIEVDDEVEYEQEGDEEEYYTDEDEYEESDYDGDEEEE